ASLLAKSDGLATGLIVYTLREAGVPVDQPVVSKGVQWLRAHQEDVPASRGIRPAWRAYSLNFDREHGGERGEPWRRMFMSDAATASSVSGFGTTCSTIPPPPGLVYPLTSLRSSRAMRNFMISSEPAPIRMRRALRKIAWTGKSVV